MKKKEILVIGLFLCIVAAAIAGCGGGSSSSSPTPSPTTDPWPAATTTWQDSGMQAISVPETSGNIAGAFDKIYTKSDGTNLYVKVTFARVGAGHNFYLLVDDKALNSGYNASRWDSNFTLWWGSMGMTFTDFDMDFIYLRGRSWDDPHKGQWRSEDEQKIANAVTGPEEGSTRNVKSSCSDVQTSGVTDFSSYEITIPYASMGLNGAHSGDRIQIVALLGRETWQGATEGTYIGARPLGIQSAIPGDGTMVAETGTDHPRIAVINNVVKCRLQ